MHSFKLPPLGGLCSILQGVFITLKYSVTAVCLGLIIGTLLAICKIVDIREQDLEKEYLLHYSGWQSKYDEWVKGGCSHIKPLNTHTTIKQASRWIRSKKKKT